MAVALWGSAVNLAVWAVAEDGFCELPLNFDVFMVYAVASLSNQKLGKRYGSS